MIDIVSKATLQKTGYTPTAPVEVSSSGIRFNSKGIEQISAFGQLQSARPVGTQKAIKIKGQYDSGMEVPIVWSDGKKMNAYERVKFLGLPDKMSDPQAASNTLLPDWEKFIDVLRIDLTQRVSALPTIRQRIYNEMFMPNADRTITLQEMLPYVVKFDEINGEGESVPMGRMRGGDTGTVTFKIYGAGWTHTLLAELFSGKLMSGTMINDAVARGYNLKRDDLAMTPLLNGTYTGAKATAASTQTGALPQELLYLTLAKAATDIAKRTHPITKRFLLPQNLKILCSATDARNIVDVIRGLPSTNERIYNSLSEYTEIITYDDEYLDTDTTYIGCTAGVIHVIVPNPYLMIPIKRGLTVESDMKPDVLKLTREAKAWYFAETIYNEAGILNFIQKVTLPAWHA